MKYAVIVSEEDPAGMNVREHLINSEYCVETSETFDRHPVYLLGDTKLYTLSRMHIYAENLDEELEADSIIFATTHKSVKNVKSLSVHMPGNWGEAKMGGKSREICPANAPLLRKLFVVLNEEGDGLDYDITMEVTHHGPFLKTPAVFIEIGSQEEQWRDRTAGAAIAKTIIRTLKEGVDTCDEACFGVGGPHYCSNFNKRVLEGQCVGHIIPKYALEYFDEKMLNQILKRTTVPMKYALVDWKGLGTEKARVVALLEDKKIEMKKSSPTF